MNNIIKIIINWQDHILKNQGIKREIFSKIYAEIQAKPIKILTGFRRSGKSFLMTQIAKQAIDEKKYSLNNVLYINFEDVQLLSHQNLEGLNLIWQSFNNNISEKGPKLVIFDEIQLIPNWQNFIRTLYEKEKDLSIFLTGSNSEMLSSELGSALAGRYIEFHILPFSFSEVLALKNIYIKDRNDYWRQEKDIVATFTDFYNFGGLPEIYSINGDSARKSYYEGIIKKVILDDIIKRFKVKNIGLLEELFSYLLGGIGNVTLISKLTNKINSIKNLQITQNTIIDYVKYFKQCFALFDLAKFDWKQSKIFNTTKKYYCIDLGVLNCFSESLVNIDSKKLENLVFLHLKKKHPMIYFGQDNLGKEIDFIVPKENGKFDKYQVCQQLTPDNQAREIGNLELANNYLKTGNTFLITEKESRYLPNSNIQQINIIEFLLGLENQ
ncbi:MAG TPA: ATP-binding protein [Candidatus Gracilibacteria bacterium]|nr:ATP-binding protein [Candidatus Gracilibacteria bacterium]